MVAAPLPLRRALYQSGSHRIKHHVSAYFKKMAVFLDQNCFVSALKNMANPVVSYIKCLGIYPVELSHAAGKIAVRSFNDEVIVIIHKAVGVAEPVVTFVHPMQSFKEYLTVLVILVYLLTGIAS